MDILIDEMEGSLWVVATHKNRLYGLEIDPADEAVRWGAIYWAKVIRIDKTLDAAFLNLDGENTGILYNADLRLFDVHGRLIKNSDLPIGKRIQTGEYLVVQAKSGYLPKLDTDDLTMEDKSAVVSMNITLPGRHLIFSPMTDENQISKRIIDKKLRKQLTRMLNNVDSIKGCILRASAASVQTDILVREGGLLKDVWDRMQEYFKGDEPSLIMEGPDAIQRIISDHAGKVIDRIEIITMERFQEVEETCEIYAPDLVTKIKPIEIPDQDLELGLFDYRDILGQIEDLFQNYVLLREGGNIIIQQTAALCAIDINRGGDTRPTMEVNIDALEEIGRQIRLRNMGGIIVVDLLKLKNKKEQETLLDALRYIVNEDPCTVQIHGITSLGLLEMTRRRRTPALMDRLDVVLD